MYRQLPGAVVEPVLVSALVVAIAEIGDETQLLAIFLASRFRKPWPIIAGILVATIANHLLAATLGYLIFGSPEGRLGAVSCGRLLRRHRRLGAVPGQGGRRGGGGQSHGRLPDHGGLLLPGGDGRQDPDRRHRPGGAVPQHRPGGGGTTLGMMAANIPAVFLGERAMKIVPVRFVRIGAAAVFRRSGCGRWWGRYEDRGASAPSSPPSEAKRGGGGFAPRSGAQRRGGDPPSALQILTEVVQLRPALAPTV